MIAQADHNVALSEFQRVSDRGRWADGMPAMYPDSPSARALVKRKKAKRQGDRLTTANVDLSRCLSGAELVAAFDAGTAFAMPLRQRMKGLKLPSAEEQQRLTGAKWKLRGARLVLCGWLAYAQAVCKLEGLAISYRELAHVLELRDPSWVAELVADLRAWGLIAADPVWVKHGLASSQRANVYRLTTAAAWVFGLEHALTVGALPAPEPVVRAPVRSRRRSPGIAHASGESPSHPEITPDQETTPREIAISPAPAARPGGGVVSASPTVDQVAPAADGSPCLPSLEREPRPVTLPGGSVEPGGHELGGKLGTLVDRVLPRDPAEGTRTTPRRDEGSLREQQRLQRERDTRRRGRLREQAEELEQRREDERRRSQLRDQAERRERDLEGPAAPAPTAAADPWSAVAEAALEQERRAELERYRAGLVGSSSPRMNRPQRDPIAERIEVLEDLERSNKLRGWELPLPLSHELAELRRQKAGGS